jgi:thiol-disulfide isomerase/thioredoxin
MKPRQFIAIAVSGLLIGAGVGAGLKYLDRANEKEIASKLPAPKRELSHLPPFNYVDTSGEIRHSKEWTDNIIVLNFWATWCPPCRKEMPLFVELQEKYEKENVKFVGIAIDEEEAVKQFGETYGLNYPSLVGDITATTLSLDLGNRYQALPFTVIAEPDGKIVLRHMGEITREQLEPKIKAAIENNRRTLEMPKRI